MKRKTSLSLLIGEETGKRKRKKKNAAATTATVVWCTDVLFLFLTAKEKKMKTFIG